MNRLLFGAHSATLNLVGLSIATIKDQYSGTPSDEHGVFPDLHDADDCYLDGVLATDSDIVLAGQRVEFMLCIGTKCSYEELVAKKYQDVAVNDTSDLQKIHKKKSGQEFLESMSRLDSMIEHDVEVCGQCFHMFTMAQVARDMLEADETENAVVEWDKRAKQQWEKGKYFQLYQTEQAAGRDPVKAFEERGWEQ